MLPTVGFYDNTSTEMHEIHHIRANHLLPPELFPVQPMPSQMPPEQIFGFGHVLAQGFDEFVCDHSPSPPTPPPQGGRGDQQSAMFLKWIHKTIKY